MIINVTYDSSVSSAPAGFTTTVNAVVQYFDSLFTDPVTINIDVGYGEVGGTALGAGALGESETYLNSYSYSQLVSALTSDAKTSTDQTVLANLPSSNPAGSASYWVSTAEAKALGLMGASSSVDGYVGFSSTPNIFDYNNADGVTAGQYDFYGVVAHEISEVMGRLILGGTSYTPLSLFDFSSSGARNMSGSQAGYFSIDGGKTNLRNFNSNAGGDIGDWASSAGNDAFLAFANPGVVLPVSQTDLTELDALGWDLSTSSSPPPPPPPPPPNPETGESPEAPTLTVSSHSLGAPKSGSVVVPTIGVAAIDSDDTVTVTIKGLTRYESITDALDGKTFKGSSVTLTAAEVASGLTLNTSYTGRGTAINTLTITANNTTSGEAATSASQTVTVSVGATAASVASQADLTLSHNAALLTQVLAGGSDAAGPGTMLFQSEWDAQQQQHAFFAGAHHHVG